MELLVGIVLLIGYAVDWVETRPLARRLKRQEEGLCMSCGYDLRGSPIRCPECGHPVSPMSRVYIQLLNRRRANHPVRAERSDDGTEHARRFRTRSTG